MPKGLPLGFTSVKEMISYLLGAGALAYGFEFADADRALLVIGAGLTLIGLPVVGSVFGGKKE